MWIKSCRCVFSSQISVEGEQKFWPLDDYLVTTITNIDWELRFWLGLGSLEIIFSSMKNLSIFLSLWTVPSKSVASTDMWRGGVTTTALWLIFLLGMFLVGNYGELIFSNNISGNGKNIYLGNSRRLYLFERIHIKYKYYYFFICRPPRLKRNS